MADLVGIQITELTPAPSLSNTTEFPVQRQGVSKAEKTTLNNLTNYVLNSQELGSFINTNTDSKIATHLSAIDPHGDRAYANSVVAAHLSAVDPHGDRAFTTNAVTTAINAHLSDTDPHGSKAYTDGKITETKTEVKLYTDTEIQTQVISKVGTTIAPLVSGKVPDAMVNQQVIFSTRNSFPTTGTTTNLYIDSGNNDIYKWNGIGYVNMTPEFDSGTISFTTDNIPEGSDVNRKYFTQALAERYDVKLGDVVNAVDLGENNNLVDRKEGNTVYIKNLESDSGIQIISMDDSLVITDDNYRFEATSEDATPVVLDYSGIKNLPLSDMSESSIYNIKGTMSAVTYEENNGVNIITDHERINVDVEIGNVGQLQDVPVPTNISVNAEGSILSGISTPSKVVRAFHKQIGQTTYDEIGFANTLATGEFSINLLNPLVDGSSVYLYTYDDTYRSEGVRFFMPNKARIREVSILSISSDGLTIKGIGERKATITIKRPAVPEDVNPEDNVLGSAVADDDGVFTLTLTEPVLENAVDITATTVTWDLASRIDDIDIVYDTITPATEVLINRDRNTISAKAPPGTTVSIIEDGIEIYSSLVLADGTLNDTISMKIFTEQVTVVSTSTEGTESRILALIFYENDEGKPEENKRVESSDFLVFYNGSKNIRNKAEYNVEYILEDGFLDIMVSNTNGIRTKWSADLKITSYTL